MCLFQSLPHSGDDVGELDLSIASDSTPVSPVTTPGTEARAESSSAVNWLVGLLNNDRVIIA